MKRKPSVCFCGACLERGFFLPLPRRFSSVLLALKESNDEDALSDDERYWNSSKAPFENFFLRISMDRKKMYGCTLPDSVKLQNCPFSYC